MLLGFLEHLVTRSRVTVPSMETFTEDNPSGKEVSSSSNGEFV